MQYLEHTYTKNKYSLFIWNWNLTRHPVFYLATIPDYEFRSLFLDLAIQINSTQ